MSSPSPAKAPKQIADTSHWPTITEAAHRLGTGERTIRRWIETNRLRSTTRAAFGRKPFTIVDPADIEKLRAEQQPPVLIRDAGSNDTGGGEIATTGSTALARPESGDVVAALVAALRGTAQQSTTMPGPFVGLADAVAISGMPASWLLAQARAGVPWAVNVGTGTKAFWRFSIAAERAK